MILRKIEFFTLLVLATSLLFTGCEEELDNIMSTRLLIHFDEVIEDSGPNRHNLTSANVTVSSSQSKFGSESGYFGEEPSLVVSNHEDFHFTDGFCIDVWLYLSSIELGNMNLFYQSDDADNYFYFCYDNVNGDLTVAVKNNQVPFNVAGLGPTATVSLSATTWYHLALTYDGDYMRLFVDGSLVDSEQRQGSFSMPDLGDDPTLNITGDPLTTYYLDEYRIIKGKPVWIDDFTPYAKPYRAIPFQRRLSRIRSKVGDSRRI